MTVATCQASWSLRTIYPERTLPTVPLPVRCLRHRRQVARKQGAKVGWDRMGRESRISGNLGEIQIRQTVNLGLNGTDGEVSGKLLSHGSSGEQRIPPAGLPFCKAALFFCVATESDQRNEIARFLETSPQGNRVLT